VRQASSYSWKLFSPLSRGHQNLTLGARGDVTRIGSSLYGSQQTWNDMLSQTRTVELFPTPMEIIPVQNSQSIWSTVLEAEKLTDPQHYKKSNSQHVN